MIAIVLLLACAIPFAIYWHSRPGLKRSGLYLPDFVVLGQATYVIGAAYCLFVLDFHYAEEVLTIGCVAFLFLCAGFAVGSRLSRRKYPRDYVSESLADFRLAKGEQTLIYLGLIPCIVVCGVFSAQILASGGLAALLPSFNNLGRADSVNLLAARKAITNSTDGYFAPGYVKQFRDLIAPILLTAIMLLSTRKRLSGPRFLLAAATLVVILVAMLLAGVRSNIFLLFVAFILAFWFIQQVRQRRRGNVRKPRKRGSMRNIALIGAGLFAYGTLSVLLGRLEAGGSPFTLAFNVVFNLFDRVVLTVPRENILSYELWSSLQSSSGEFWRADLMGVLPGSRGVALSNLLHNYLGGSIEGNSVLGMPADIWINWGWGGVVVFPLIYALFITLIDVQLTRFRSPIAFGVKIIFATVLVQIYSPFGFLLYGGAVAIIALLGAKMLHAQKTLRRMPPTANMPHACPPTPRYSIL